MKTYLFVSLSFAESLHRQACSFVAKALFNCCQGRWQVLPAALASVAQTVGMGLGKLFGSYGIGCDKYYNGDKSRRGTS